MCKSNRKYKIGWFIPDLKGDYYLGRDARLVNKPDKAVMMTREDVNAFLIQINDTELWARGGKGSHPIIVETP